MSDEGSGETAPGRVVSRLHVLHPVGLLLGLDPTVRSAIRAYIALAIGR